MGRWPEAEREYRQVLNKAPNDVEILMGLADVALWQARPSEALQYPEQAKSSHPRTQTSLRSRRGIRCALGYWIEEGFVIWCSLIL